jgi:hypothetical protein
VVFAHNRVGPHLDHLKGVLQSYGDLKDAPDVSGDGRIPGVFCFLFCWLNKAFEMYVSM